MKLLKWASFGFALLCANVSISQIVIGEQEELVKDTKKVKGPKDKIEDNTNFTTEIFFGAGVMRTFRNISPNPNELFGKPLGERANEQAMVRPEFYLGIRKKLNGFLMIEGNVRYLQSGEKYAFSSPDSTHNYSVIYNELGVGLKLFYYKTIKKVDILVGAGLMPTFRMKMKRQDHFVTSAGKEIDHEDKSKNGLNNVGVNVAANAGIQYNVHPRVGLFAMFEYRYNLTNTFLKYEPYKHHLNGIGASFGVSIKM